MSALVHRKSLTALASLLVAIALVVASAAPGEARNVRRGGHVNVNHKVNVSKKNVNINKKVNVDVNRNAHRNVDVDWDYNHRHPVATGVAVGTAAAITAAAIGSIAYSVPASCRYQTTDGVRYYRCGDTWYRAALFQAPSSSMWSCPGPDRPGAFRHAQRKSRRSANRRLGIRLWEVRSDGIK